MAIDEIPSEMIKVLGYVGEKALIELCCQIYLRGEWPDDWLKAVLVPIEKKRNTFECEEHRTISLISHASKVILRVLANRLEVKAKEYLSRDQYDCCKAMGTKEAIGIMRVLGERSIEHVLDVYV